jgi:hypothetical protein
MQSLAKPKPSAADRTNRSFDVDETIRFACPGCGKSLKAPAKLAGKRAKCSCGQEVQVPTADSPSGPTAVAPPPAFPEKKSVDIPTGAVGLVLAAIFFFGILIAPGEMWSVMVGGILGTAGFAIAIVGIVTGSGRIAGVAGIVLYVLGWVVNTLAIGRL